MKKSGLLLAAAVVAGMLLTGCGASQKSTFSPSVSCVYVAQDGSVSSALVKEYEGDTVNSKDLQQYLEAPSSGLTRRTVRRGWRRIRWEPISCRLRFRALRRIKEL